MEMANVRGERCQTAVEKVKKKADSEKRWRNERRDEKCKWWNVCTCLATVWLQNAFKIQRVMRHLGVRFTEKMQHIQSSVEMHSNPFRNHFISFFRSDFWHCTQT